MKVGDLIVDKNGVVVKLIDDSVYNSFKVEPILIPIYYKNERVPKEWFRPATPEEIAHVVAEKLKGVKLPEFTTLSGLFKEVYGDYLHDLIPEKTKLCLKILKT